MKIIKSAEREPYKKIYHPLIDRYFTGEGTFVGSNAPNWEKSPFFFSSAVLDDDGKPTCHISILMTNEASYKKVLAGELKESEMQPWQPGEYGLPYLYWTSLIVENRLHTPYLIKSVFGEIAETARKWELLITHVYTIAFNRVIERLLRRYHFVRAGGYKEGKEEYAIMISKVSENPYLSAFIPEV